MQNAGHRKWPPPGGSRPTLFKPKPSKVNVRRARDMTPTRQDLVRLTSSVIVCAAPGMPCSIREMLNREHELPVSGIYDGWRFIQGHPRHTTCPKI